MPAFTTNTTVRVPLPNRRRSWPPNTWKSRALGGCQASFQYQFSLWVCPLMASESWKAQSMLGPSRARLRSVCGFSGVFQLILNARPAIAPC